MPDTLIADIQKLTADEIAERLDDLAEQEQALRVLLRSKRAIERVRRQRDNRPSIHPGNRTEPEKL